MKYTFARYEPIKVTFKKKLNLRDLTPDRDDKPLTIRVRLALISGFFIILGLIWIVAYLGNKYGW